MAIYVKTVSGADKVKPYGVKGAWLKTAAGADLLWKAGKSLGDLPVGTLVKLKKSGTPRDYIVVHQGRPSTLYDTSCDGTWLLMQDCCESHQWHSESVNDYANSTIHSYLNSTFLGLLESNIQAAIKQVKLPYRAGPGTGQTVTSGASGISAKIFLLSSTEVNLVNGLEPTNEGTCLSYFSGTAQDRSDSKRIAHLNRPAVYWWLRSPYCHFGYGFTYSIRVTPLGNMNNSNCITSSGIRPAFILPKEALVDDAGNVLE